MALFNLRQLSFGLFAGVGLGHVFAEHVGTLAPCVGPSMLPTIEVRGDMVWINPSYRRGRGIKVGDVVSFRHPTSPREAASKRVIGLPGDFVLRDSPGVKRGVSSALHGKSPQETLQGHPQLEIRKAVSVPGQVDPTEGKGVTEVERGAVVAGRAETEPAKMPEMIQVPTGHCWLAGDNLSWSRDSRDYGPVPLALIRGKVVAKIWPWSRSRWMDNTLRDIEEG